MKSFAAFLLEHTQGRHVLPDPECPACSLPQQGRPFRPGNRELANHARGVYAAGDFLTEAEVLQLVEALEDAEAELEELRHKVARTPQHRAET